MIHLRLGGALLSLSGLPLPRLPQDAHPFITSVEEGDPRVTIYFDAPAPPGVSDRFQRGDFHFAMSPDRREAWARLGVQGGVFTALELALQRALLPEGGLIIHAAAVVLEGEGWLLLGPSGAGKSTSARVGGFDRVLTDEMAILRAGPDGYRLWGTPFWSQGRTLPIHIGDAPLRRLIQLGKSPELEHAPLRPDEAAVYLLECVTLYEEAPRARRGAFELACEVAEATPAARLSVPKERPWARTAYPRLRRAMSSASPSPTPSPSPCTGT